MLKRDRAFWLAVLGMAAAGVAMAIWLQNSHPSVTYDSAFYLSASRNLAAGRGLITDITKLGDMSFTEPFKRWSPLFPVLGGALVLLGIPGITALALISALSFGATIVFIALIARRLAGVPAGILAGAYSLLSLSWWQMGSAALSDMLFTAVVAATFWLLAEAIARRSNRWLLAAGIGAAICALTRQIGLFVPFACGLWLLIDALRRPKLAKFAKAAAFGFGSATPFAIWTLLNPFWAGHGSSTAAPALATFPENVNFFVRTLTQDFGLALEPFSAAGVALTAVRAALLLATLGVIGVSIAKWWKDDSTELLVPILPGVLHFAVYFLFITILRSIGNFAYLETRLVSPTYAPLLAAIAATSVWAFERARKLEAPVWRTVAASLAVLAVLAVPRWGAMPSKIRMQRVGTEFAAPRYRDDVAVKRISELRPDFIVTSSTGYSYLYTGIPTKPLPIKVEDTSFRISETAVWLGRNFVIYIPDPYEPAVRKRFDVEEFLDQSRYEILVYTTEDLLVRRRP